MEGCEGTETQTVQSVLWHFKTPIKLVSYKVNNEWLSCRWW